MNISNMILLVLVPLFFYLIYSLANLEYAYSMRLLTDDVCLICDMLDNFGDLRL